MQASTTVDPGAISIVPWSRLGDEKLACRAAKGNGAAFAALYERYYGPLLGYTRSILLDIEDARDATQTALENALRALPSREPGRPLRPWLYRIAHNEAIAIVRRRRPQTELTPAFEPVVPGPDVDAELRGRLTQLVDDLRGLPERQRGALVMRELSGLSYAEIGAALELSVEAARRAVFDARTSLHDAADGRATQCVTVRHCISDGDRRALRARGIRAHLRSCDDCDSFRRSIDARRADLHVLAPWASGAAVMGAIGSGALLAGGGSSAASGGITWASLPVAIKGVAVAAAVATTGTAAVEIKNVTKTDPAVIARIVQPSPKPAEAATLRATPSPRPSARTSPAPKTRSGSGRTPQTSTPRADSTAPKTPRPAAVTTAPALPQAVPVVDVPPPDPAPAPAAKQTPREAAVGKLEPLTEAVQQVLLDVQTLASNGTKDSLALASSLLDRSLSPLLTQINQILTPLGLELPGVDTSASPSKTNVLGSVQHVLDGVQSLAARLVGRT